MKNYCIIEILYVSLHYQIKNKNNMKTFENENWLLTIDIDENPMNPRTEFDNATKMLCFHKRYNLGDKNDFKYFDFNGWEEFEKEILKRENVAVILPIYMYDHSGITISTTPFSCKWDSGQIGFVYITKKEVFDNYNPNGKRMTKKLIEKANKLIQSEIETYKQYLEGDVYCYTCKDKINNETDSCYGFFSSDFWNNGIAENIPKEAIKSLYSELSKEYGENETYIK